MTGMSMELKGMDHHRTVRLWSDTGSCTRVLAETTDFLYGLCHLEDEGTNSLVAVGENGTLVQWKGMAICSFF